MHALQMGLPILRNKVVSNEKNGVVKLRDNVINQITIPASVLLVALGNTQQSALIGYLILILID